MGGKDGEASLESALADEVARDGSAEYVVSCRAHAKALLHAAKFPFAQVNGALLGKGKGGVVHVEDAVPLFHSVMLAPMLETAMALLEEYCRSDQTPEGTQIVGWYCGPARSNYQGVPPSVVRIANKIRGKNDSCGVCLLMVEASKLADEKQAGLGVYTYKDSSSWVPASKSKFDNTGSETFTKLLKEGAASKLDDFDEWLEQPSDKDWRNKDLVK